MAFTKSSHALHRIRMRETFVNQFIAARGGEDSIKKTLQQLES